MIFPPLEQLRKEGAKGRSKIAQYTRFAALAFALLQSIGVSKILITQNIVLEPGLTFYFLTGLTLATGTLFLMWLGEMMSEKGVGNGISLIIFSGIVSRFPEAVGQFFTQAKMGQIHVIAFIAIILAVVLSHSWLFSLNAASVRYQSHIQAGSKVKDVSCAWLSVFENQYGW